MEKGPIPEMNQQAREVFETKDFQRFYKEGEMERIDWREIPPWVIQHFEKYSERFISPEDYKPYDFEDAFTIKYLNGDVSYVAEQKKTYTGTNGATEELVYLVDTRDGEEIGHGEIRRDISKSPVLRGEPFVGFIKTEGEYTRSGLGRRRLQTMNAYVQMKYGQPLYSGDTITNEARALFAKLVEEGEADIIANPKNPTYPSYRMHRIES